MSRGLFGTLGLCGRGLRGLELLDLRQNAPWDASDAGRFLEAVLKEFGRGLQRPNGSPACPGALLRALLGASQGLDLRSSCRLSLLPSRLGRFEIRCAWRQRFEGLLGQVRRRLATKTGRRFAASPRVCQWL